MPKFTDNIEFGYLSQGQTVWANITKVPISFTIITSNSSHIYFTYNTHTANLAYAIAHTPDANKATAIASDILQNYGLYDSKGTLRLTGSGYGSNGKAISALVAFRTDAGTYLSIEFSDKTTESMISITSCITAINSR